VALCVPKAERRGAQGRDNPGGHHQLSRRVHARIVGQPIAGVCKRAPQGVGFPTRDLDLSFVDAAVVALREAVMTCNPDVDSGRIAIDAVGSLGSCPSRPRIGSP
jgi:hypothetical protein